MSNRRARQTCRATATALGCLAAGLLYPAGEAAAATLTTLYSFCAQKNCTDGSQPEGSLIFDAAGNLYSTTLHGGSPAIANNGAYGYGTAFELAPDGTETVLHSFKKATHDGYGAYYGFVMDPSGNLYSTTISGGATKQGLGFGTVFKIDTAGAETPIYQFCAKKECADGHYGAGPVIIDGAGNLYGATVQGKPNGGGVVFELKPSRKGKWKETVLYSFPSNVTPSAGLVMDGAGNLYGTTSGVSGSNQTGTVFELTPAGGAHWQQTTLYTFCSVAQCADGAYPFGGLILDAAGNLYGTTESGGDRQLGDGTVYELSPNGGGQWSETVLYRFGGGVDGYDPMAGLVMDGAGNLYGTTYWGGSGGVSGVGAGTVFKLDPNGTLTTLYSFCSQDNCADGRSPTAGLIMDASGVLYGTTTIGGANYNASAGDYGGTIFSLTP